MAMKDNDLKVSIIIPHYNRKEYLQKLLPSLANQTFRDFEVVIIDDCSPDRSVVDYATDFITEHGNMRLVENVKNLGFVRTCNQGVKLARGEYVCFLNQDTETATAFVARNVEVLDSDPAIGALSCIVVDQHGQNWFSGGFYKNGSPVNLADDFQGVRTVDFVAGTAAFYRKEVFERIGLFDDNYGMYHEDVEFGLRLRAQTHYRACMFSDKLVTHYGIPSIPTGEKLYFLNRNLVLLAKTYSPKSVPRIVLLHMPREVIGKIAASVLRLKPAYSWMSLHVVRGTFDGLRGK